MEIGSASAWDMCVVECDCQQALGVLMILPRIFDGIRKSGK